MATKLTSQQLKDELISWCIKVWKANGTPVPFQSAIQKMAQLGPQEDLDEEKPDNETLLLSMDKGYLEVTLDDKPSAAGDLLERRQKLDRIIRDHPEISAELDPLLDVEIASFPSIDPQEASKLKSMNRDQKIRLAAKYRLLRCKGIDDEPAETGAKDEPSDKGPEA